ncbi:MAG: hypothetical protein Q4G09_02760 [Clostridia bacterium]|nr:hypothetical protein [Clostridia bacterium]
MENNLFKAYAEVDKILSLMESKYVEKIPKRMRELFKNEKLNGYEPTINAKIPLDEQNLQRKTLSILAMLNINYWCEDENEKKELIALYAENDKKREEELRKKYNPDNLFMKREQIIENNEVKQEKTQLIEYKEQNIFKRIINRIMKFFKNNN